MIERNKVYAVIDGERKYQSERWAGSHTGGTLHEIAAWVLFMQHHLAQAAHIAATADDEAAALHELRKVVALGVACMEQHGALMRQTAADRA